MPLAIPAIIKGLPLAAKALPWKLIGFCALGMLVAGLFLALKLERTQNDKLKAQIEKCSEARRADRATYQRAQAEASLLNKAQVQRIEKKQQEITNEVSSDLNARLERLRRELSKPRPSAAGGSPGSAGAGPDGESRPGSDEEAGLCLAPDELLSAAESEERHDRLIDWIEKQLKVVRQ